MTDDEHDAPPLDPRAWLSEDEIEDIQAGRAYVSRLWAEDWDSDDDTVYDEPGL